MLEFTEWISEMDKWARKLESANYLQDKIEETQKVKVLNMKSKSKMNRKLIWTKGKGELSRPASVNNW